jgi:hypothetical protein
MVRSVSRQIMHDLTASPHYTSTTHDLLIGTPSRPGFYGGYPPGSSSLGAVGAMALAAGGGGGGGGAGESHAYQPPQQAAYHQPAGGNAANLLSGPHGYS